MKDVGDKDGSTRNACHLRVGCALLAKKVARYLTPRMLHTAAANGIELVLIDYTRSLLDQGPFDVIIHKLRPNAAWELMLQEYKHAHPGVCIIDKLDKIRALHNRATMLTPLQGEGITLQQPPPLQELHQQALWPASPQQQHTSPQLVRVQAPLQVEILEGATESDAQAALAAAGLSPPLLCKPLWTDGREGSHGLAVLHDLESLGRLLRGAVSSEFKPPLVVQQFVEHGGVLFKVYVLGSQTVVTARPSLGETVLESEQGVQQLPRISCVSVFGKQHLQQQQQQTSAAQRASTNPSAASQQQQQPSQPGSTQASAAAPAAGVPGNLAAAAAAWKPPAPATALCPPDWVTAALAATLRQELGMQLFNFDLIVPEQQLQQGLGDAEPVPEQQAPPLCYVVDINYFPGVDKIPDFEQRFVAFLKAAAAECGHGVAGEGDSQQQQQGVQQLEMQQSEVLNLVPLQADAAAPVAPTSKPAAAAAAAAVPAAEIAAQAPGQPSVAAVAAACRQLRHSWSSGSGASRHGSGSCRSAGAADSSSNGSSNGSGRAFLRSSSSSGYESGYESPAAEQRRQQQRHHHHHARAARGPHHSHSGVGLDKAGVLGSSPPQLQVAGCS